MVPVFFTFSLFLKICLEFGNIIPFNFKVFCALWIFNSFKFLTIFNNLKLNLSLKVLIDFNFYLVWEASKIFTFLKKLQYPVLAKYLDQIQIFFQIYVILQLDDRRKFIFVSILFPEMRAFARACTSTHPSIFLCAINVINDKILLRKYVAHFFSSLKSF